LSLHAQRINEILAQVDKDAAGLCVCRMEEMSNFTGKPSVAMHGMITADDGDIMAAKRELAGKFRPKTLHRAGGRRWDAEERPGDNYDAHAISLVASETQR
jgi:hypothetical protein